MGETSEPPEMRLGEPCVGHIQSEQVSNSSMLSVSAGSDRKHVSLPSGQPRQLEATQKLTFTPGEAKHVNHAIQFPLISLAAATLAVASCYSSSSSSVIFFLMGQLASCFCHSEKDAGSELGKMDA